jgi:signal peptidase I
MKKPTAPNRPLTFKQRLRAFSRTWIGSALLVAVVVFPFKSAVAECSFVPSGSMKPTILEGDLLLVNKLAYDLKVPFTTTRLATWANPQPGDIVVCFSPKDGTRLVKRVVAQPGDTVEMRNDRLFLNGNPVAYAPLAPMATTDLSAAEKSTTLFATEKLAGQDHAMMVLPGRMALRSFGPVQVPAGEYFVMGDNRDDSFDSRYFGFVPREEIVGQTKMVVASVDLDKWGRPRMNRWFSRLDPAPMQTP